MGHKRTKTSRIAHPRYMAFFALLVSGFAAFTVYLPMEMALIGGFDIAAAAFALSLLSAWQHSSPDTIRKTASRDDGGRQILLALTAIIVTVVTISVGILVGDKDALTAGRIALLVLTLLSGWVFTNLVFAIHYAHVFYDAQPSGDDQGGLDFPGGDAPVFADFVYFSFVIGMTCQTADINLTSQVFRRVVTFHGLFAFVFNLGILALMVNVLAGTH
jgi:uncharacterized membrane protein